MVVRFPILTVIPLWLTSLGLFISNEKNGFSFRYAEGNGHKNDTKTLWPPEPPDYRGFPLLSLPVMRNGFFIRTPALTLDSRRRKVNSIPGSRPNLRCRCGLEAESLALVR
jgi:hypothetical protein